MTWTKLADGVTATNPLFADVTKAVSTRTAATTCMSHEMGEGRSKVLPGGESVLRTAGVQEDFER